MCTASLLPLGTPTAVHKLVLLCIANLLPSGTPTAVHKLVLLCTATLPPLGTPSPFAVHLGQHGEGLSQVVTNGSTVVSPADRALPV